MLYLDETDEADGFKIPEHITEHFPEKKSISYVTKEQRMEIDCIYNRIKSNFWLGDLHNDGGCSNLTRMNLLPRNYTLREEYVRCGKQKTNKCKSCVHGPYFYAYWREKLPKSKKSRLRKKYLGTVDPRL